MKFVLRNRFKSHYFGIKYTVIQENAIKITFFQYLVFSFNKTKCSYDATCFFTATVVISNGICIGNLKF